MQLLPTLNRYLARAVVTAAMSICAPTFAFAQQYGSTGEEIYVETCNKCHGLITQESSWLDFVPDDGSEVQLAVILARGPTLNGIFNRPVAIIEGYSYSNAMREFAGTGAIWDRETLDLYITDSRAMVKGYMAVKLEEEDRQLVLDYLANVAPYQE